MRIWSGEWRIKMNNLKILHNENSNLLQTLAVQNYRWSIEVMQPPLTWTLYRVLPAPWKRAFLQKGAAQGWKTECCAMLSHFRHVWLYVAPWSVAYQAPLSVGWSGFQTQGLNLCLLHCRWTLYRWATGEALENRETHFNIWYTWKKRRKSILSPPRK